MKSLFTIIIAVLINFQNFSFTGGHSESKVRENTIKSLLTGLESENLGLMTSSIYMIGELKITEAIIPLMKLLKNHDIEEVRICSALALYKIGTPMSIYSVKQASIFDDSQRVVKLSSGFYKEHLRNEKRDDEKYSDSTYVAAK